MVTTQNQYISISEWFEGFFEWLGDSSIFSTYITLTL